jgi:hypothetical protein
LVGARGALRAQAVMAPLIVAHAAVARADVVLDWNSIALEVTSGNPPGLLLQARSLAITHLAMHDALNSITGEHETYAGAAPAVCGASEEAAVVAAAHHALTVLHPSQTERLDLELAESLAAIDDQRDSEAGVAVGVAAAEAVLALRADDGSTASVPYMPVGGPGRWVPTPPAFAPWLDRHWALVEPFVLETPDQFLPNPPPALTSREYARDYAEVLELGAADSASRPAESTELAMFYLTAGALFYNPAAQQVARAQGATLADNARLFAHLNTAIIDSVIACLDAKVHYDFWRPVTAIQQAHTDGNPRTVPDPDWAPLLVTPPFPSYPSGHACGAGAARYVLEDEYGKSGFTVTLTSPTAPGAVYTYTAWKQIADDVDDARVFGGIHFRFDQKAGQRLGRRVGRYIRKQTLRRN